MYNVGAVYIVDNKDYNKESGTLPVKDMDLRAPVYLGGLPGHVIAPHFTNRGVGFTGCMRNPVINGELTLDMSAPDLGGKETGTGRCYSDVQPGLGFNASAWIHFGEKDVSIISLFGGYVF